MRLFFVADLYNQERGTRIACSVLLLPSSQKIGGAKLILVVTAIHVKLTFFID